MRFPAPHCALARPVFRAAARQPHSSRAARDLRGPSLDSPLPLETPPLRCGVGGGGALHSGARLCRCGKGCMWCFAFCCCVAAVAAAFLRRFWLRQQPRGCLRRPRRDRGIASSPYSLLGFSGTPLYRRRSARGGGGRALRFGAALCHCYKGLCMVLCVLALLCSLAARACAVATYNVRVAPRSPASDCERAAYH